MSVHVCTLASVIQHTKHMRHIILPSVACPTQYFSTLFHKWHKFLEKDIEHKTCVVIFSTNFF